jgi:hypothetical protein
MQAWGHGDVILKKVKRGSVKGLKLKPDRVLAIGRNGHPHTVAGKAQLYTTNKNGLLLKAAATVEIEHPEHPSIELPAGDYAVEIQRESDWFSEEVRNVQD